MLDNNFQATNSQQWRRARGSICPPLRFGLLENFRLSENFCSKVQNLSAENHHYGEIAYSKASLQSRCYTGKEVARSAFVASDANVYPTGRQY